MNIARGFGGLGVAGFALGVVLGAAEAQAPPHQAFARLPYEQALNSVGAAGCQRIETATYVAFSCAPGASDGIPSDANERTWYFTLPGRAEHPGYSVAYTEKLDDCVGPLGREVRTWFKGADETAFDSWRKSLPKAAAPKVEVDRFTLCSPEGVPLLSRLPKTGEPFPRTP